MTRLRVALAALIVALPVSAAQSSIERPAAQAQPVKGWSAVAGLSGAEVLDMARTLPRTADAAGDQPWCDSAAAVQQSLDAEFDERMVTRRGDGTQLWGSDVMGTWTVVLARADQTNCIIASGIGYQDGANPGTFYAQVGLTG
ncbi:hypothetical protein [Paracoccus luteus]|uniref:hypothetical protein n=1 Tax=Paracoccus luteus TaxID=2508543 RepID=UPI00106F0FA0|nr:hypothetical protein [Paracoccus luteus]